MPQAPFAVPLGIGAALLSIALIIWLLTNVDFVKEGLTILVVAVIGFVIYLANRLFVSKSKAEIN